MTDQIRQQITRLDLEDSPPVAAVPPEMLFTDISAQFFQIVHEIPFGTVIKSPQFKLLHGTHALEVMNPKLDSALLVHTDFNIEGAIRTPDDLNAVMAGLIGGLCAWLDNNSLSVSVFSCAYIERLLVDYRDFGAIDLSLLDGSTLDLDSIFASDSESPCALVDGVLRVFCIGLLKVAAFIVRLGMSGVIYEEEDLNTQTMDFDLFQKVELAEVFQLLDQATHWVKQREPSTAYHFCLLNLKLVRSLLDLTRVLEISLEPYVPIENQPPEMVRRLKNVESGLDEAVSILDEYKDFADYFTALKRPEGCFSTNIQKTQNNRSPPKPVMLLDFGQSIESVRKLVTDSRYVLRVTETRTSLELQEFLCTCMSMREKTASDCDVLGIHVVARAWLQLFLIRDDETIMGSPRKYDLGVLLFDIMRRTCVEGAKILESDNMRTRQKLQQLLTDMKVPFYNFLTCVSQNPARQREFIAKQVIYWDKFQVEAEALETESNAAVQDNFDDAGEDNGNTTSSFPVLPIASFVYYSKLLSMSFLMLKSIELRLFKDLRELNVGYWLASYIMGYTLQHLRRLLDIIRLRRRQLASYPKRIKRARKQDKKQRLRLEFERKSQHAEQLVQAENFLQWRVSRVSVLRGMIELKLVLLQVLNFYGHLKLPKMCKTSEQLLFRLQLKPFGSVGVPELPSFTDYQESMTKFNDAFGKIVDKGDFGYFRKLISSKTEALNGLFQHAKTHLQLVQFPSFLSTVLLDDLTELKRASVYSELELTGMLRQLEANPQKGKDFSVTIATQGHHQFFPNISV